MSANGVHTQAGLTARKAAIRTVLEGLAGVAGDVGLSSTARDVRDTRIPKLDEGEVTLVVLGEFNHGKSTFINALLGEPVLPTGVLPTTAALVELRHGPALRAEVVRDDGSRQGIEPGELGAYITVEGKANAASDDVARIEIAHPAPFLANKVTVVDTPGVNDLAEQRADITYGYLPRADAILFLLDAGQILTASERRFLEERILRTTRDRLIFVIAKADLLDPDELQAAMRYAREHLSKIVPDPPVLAVSAKRALRGDREGSGFPALLAALDEMLGSERQQWLLDRALVEASRLSSFVRQSVGIRRASLALPADELEQRVRRAHERLRDGRQALVMAAQTIRSESDGLKARVRQDLALFADEFARVLPAEIEAASAEDVERYLAPFIEDTWKAWLEAEGEVMAKALEALAEQIVAVANERLDTVTREVAEELGGPEAARLDVSVNGFGAEVSVLAVGALGSTVLLFVSALVGGVLAVLTPIAAALVRSQALRAAKEDAKRRAPEVVREVAAALPAKLDEIVDRFAERLETFVAEAGAALGRGIAEVLDRALAEKRRIAAEGASGPNGDEAARLAEALAALKRIDEQIADIRQAVWDR